MTMHELFVNVSLHYIFTTPIIWPDHSCNNNSLTGSGRIGREFFTERTVQLCEEIWGKVISVICPDPHAGTKVPECSSYDLGHRG